MEDYRSHFAPFRIQCRFEYKMALMTAPVAPVTTGARRNIRKLHAIAQCTVRANAPTLSTTMTGSRRPNALEPFKIAICATHQLKDKIINEKKSHRI